MRTLPRPKYIVWSCDPDKLDASDPWVRRWWIQQVLARGRMEDVRQLDLEEVRRLLPELRLSDPIRGLWTRYFDDPGSARHPDAAAKRPR